jgi:putative serine protease PepD
VKALLAALAALLVLAAPAAAQVPVDPGAAALQGQLEAAVSAASPSVVQVKTEGSIGSGVVLDGRGDVVTNAHVVAGAKRVSVLLSDGTRHKAKIAGSFDLADVAVVRIADATPPPAVFADSAGLRLGQVVLALGSPLGLRGSVTQGIVSAVGRIITEDTGVTLGGLVQFSAPIFPGNSGGALVDLRGAVVGLPTLGGEASGGLGFAIPSSTVLSIGNQLAADGKVTHSGLAWLGLAAAPVHGGGLRVLSVTPGGPAQRAGIARRSRLVAIDGRRVSSTYAVQRVLLAHRPGDAVKVLVDPPAGLPRELPLVLGERPT